MTITMVSNQMMQEGPRNTKMEICFVDRISELPEFILHEILSLLSIKEAARTMVLSKHWCTVWESFPILDFHMYSFNPLDDFCTQHVDNFLDVVKKELTRFALSNRKVQKLNLIFSHYDDKLYSKLDECLELALDCGAVKICIQHWILPPYFHYLPSSHKTTISHNRFKYCSLQELDLMGLSICEESINGIIQNCPKLRSLRLRCMDKLRELKIKKLYRLEVAMIFCSDLRIVMDAPNLRELYVSYHKSTDFANVDLASCLGLRKLSLRNLRITDELFRSLISRFPLLEDLSIIDSMTLRRVTISAKCLEHLVLNFCNKITAIEIDAPALSSLRCETEVLAPLFLKSTSSHLEIFHRLWLKSHDTHRFVNVREFLATSTMVDSLTVYLFEKKFAGEKFDIDELREVVIPPAFQLAHLKLEFDTSETPLFDEGTVMDGLLWSCHPKKIYVSWGNLTRNSFIRILCEGLLGMEKSPVCCGSSTVKCWRHGLKSARIEGALDEQHWTLSLPLDDAKASVICFILEWDDSIC